MISELHIDPKKLKRRHARFAYAAQLPWIVSMRFQPGLTLLLGPNGSGKSTLLKMLAAGCLAEEVGFPVLSFCHLQDRFDLDDHDRLDGISVHHDGQVLFADSRESRLPIGAVDVDMMGSLLKSLAAKHLANRSHGQRSLVNIDIAVNLMAAVVEPEQYVDTEPLLRSRLRRYKHPPDERKTQEIRQAIVKEVTATGKRIQPPFPVALRPIEGRHLNTTYQARLKHVERDFAPALPSGKPTLLIDEPEAGLSLPLQARLWRLITDPKVLDAFQILLASHSLFAFQAAKALGPTVHVVETEPGFTDSVWEELGFAQRSA